MNDLKHFLETLIEKLEVQKSAKSDCKCCGYESNEYFAFRSGFECGYDSAIATVLKLSQSLSEITDDRSDRQKVVDAIWRASADVVSKGY